MLRYARAFAEGAFAVAAFTVFAFASLADAFPVPVASLRRL